MPKPPSSNAASVTITFKNPSIFYDDIPCTFDAEYHWWKINGHGKELAAQIQIVESDGNVVATAQRSAPVSTGSWTWRIFKADGPDGPVRTLFARGSLFDSGGVEIPESVTYSFPIESPCAGAWHAFTPNVVPL